MSRSPKSVDLVTLFAALADPTRLRLLNLMAGREVCVCYFVEILRQGQPKISRHLAYLRNAGIVSARREGKWMHYRISSPADTEVAATLAAVLASLRKDNQMQADLSRLDRACCTPQKLVMPESAPRPTLIAALTES
jgi:ArsR family transcriptional regulator